MIKFQILRLAQLFDNPGDPVNLPKTEPSSAKVQSLMFYIFTVMGAICVLMITVAGFKYVMSMGDPGATKKAKDTILYAFIGLVVSVSAVTIIKFVLGNI